MPFQTDNPADLAAILNATNEVQQYGRKCTLLVGTAAGDKALDLSALRIRFSVKRSASMTPNSADIRVYNLKYETAVQIKKEFKQVILQAGYEGNFGVIFSGNIKQVILGRESATDTFVDIIAGDGDRAFKYSVVATTLAAGSSTMDHVNAAISSMNPNGVTAGSIHPPAGPKLTRGKVIYDSAKNVLRKSANASGSVWSIQNEKVQFISESGYNGNTVVVLNSTTGMIGTPQQTVQGVNVNCLLNPRLEGNGRVQINEALVAKYKIDFTIAGSANTTPVNLTSDGVYYILALEHSGDTRGNEWYSKLVTLTVSLGSNPYNTGVNTAP